jgi:septal ring factor EnvC (AmiA/AmiB activator)
MVDENERLRAVIGDMRREMDDLRDMSHRQSQELRHTQSRAAPTIAELEEVTQALEEANVQRQEQQQRLDEVLRDNKRMTEENHKLKSNCVRADHTGDVRILRKQAFKGVIVRSD